MCSIEKFHYLSITSKGNITGNTMATLRLYELYDVYFLSYSYLPHLP